jgi:hypothetical protein
MRLDPYLVSRQYMVSGLQGQRCKSGACGLWTCGVGTCMERVSLCVGLCSLMYVQINS